MKVTRFLTAPVLALFDFRIYREVRDEKPGTAVLYNLYLTALLGVALTIFGFSFMPKIDAFVHWLKTEYPGMTLSADGMKLDKPGRVILTHPQLGPLVAFDDSVETVTPSEIGSIQLFVTSKMVYTQKEARSFGGFSNENKAAFKNTPPLHLDGEIIERGYRKYKNLVVGGILFIVLFFMFVVKLILGLIFGALGFLIQLFLPRKLEFEKLFVLASFAFSIELWITILGNIPNLGRFFNGGIGLVLSLVYFVIAISIQPKPTPEN